MQTFRETKILNDYTLKEILACYGVWCLVGGGWGAGEGAKHKIEIIIIIKITIRGMKRDEEIFIKIFFYAK
jgi:hypothetical protein